MAALIDLIEPHYPKTSKKGGRHPYPLAVMLRIHLLQQWYSLSDPAMEEALIEVPTMRRFAGIDLISDRIPDETTILTFRHLLEKHDLGEQIFETVKAHLSARGMTMRQGTIVDATLIAAPSSTKNKEGKRDEETATPAGHHCVIITDLEAQGGKLPGLVVAVAVQLHQKSGQNGAKRRCSSALRASQRSSRAKEASDRRQDRQTVQSL